MSEKATLLSSIPPVKKAGSEDSSENTEATPLNDNSISTLAAQDSSHAVEVVASEAVVAEADSITVFEFVTYASFVLNFLLAGAAAILLFKKASKLLEERFKVSTIALAITCILIVLHGVFATYLYNSHLNGKISSAPLFMTMFGWVLIAPMVGFITRNLLARGDKPNRNAAFVDAGIYAFIFILVAFGVSTSIKTNAAMISSIVAGFLMIVPIARSMSAFKLAKARHKELNEKSDKILISGLLIIPAIMPVVSFAFVCGLSATATLFLINFITFDFVLVVALSMIASADVLQESSQVEEEAVEGATSAVAATSSKSSSKVGEENIASGNLDDPIIQFLNSEEGGDYGAESGTRTQPHVQKSSPKTAPRKLPPRKPSSSGITPPKKPGTSKGPAPNAPTGKKAPSKPKKRF